MRTDRFLQAHIGKERWQRGRREIHIRRERSQPGLASTTRGIKRHFRFSFTYNFHA